MRVGLDTCHHGASRTLRDEEFYYELIHESCPLVELDRSKKTRRKGKKVNIGRGSSQRISTCMPHTRHGTKADIVKWVLQSEELYAHKQLNPDCSESPSLIQTCICDCIKEAKTGECVCPVCYDFEHRLRVFNSGVTELREQSPCSCCSIDSKFFRATKSPMAFQEAVCCDKIDFGGLELPHSPDFTPRFTAFNCVVDDKPASHTGVKMCKKCGLNRIIPRGCPIMESLSSKKVRWNKRIETPYKTKKDEWSTKKVLREHTGLLSELWDEIILSQRHYLFHTWATSYIRWQ